MDILHLDSAACGRTSQATRDAVAAHMRREAEIGGYVAEAAAAATIDRLRADLARLFALDADGIAFVGSAQEALGTLLERWPLRTGATIGVLPSEWGPNLDAFEEHGYRPVVVHVDAIGRVDLERLAAVLRAQPPDVMHLVLVSAHRGLVQPLAEASALCREAGVPLWVDAAQATGQVAALGGADAVYGTSRKWLCGPRGAGFLGVRAERRSALVLPKHPRYADDLPALQRIELEAHVAGRVGLAQAVAELLEAGPERVAARLAEVGDATREALADVPSWQVVAGQVGSITALRPTAGQDVVRTRQRLLDDHGILTTASLPWRAPLELDQAWLRVSPHVDVTEADLTTLARALAEA